LLESGVTSTLIDQIAPLQPEIISSGFERNRQWLDQPVTFPVRFTRFVPKVAPLPFIATG
jgi:hypothetical protein